MLSSFRGFRAPTVLTLTSSALARANEDSKRKRGNLFPYIALKNSYPYFTSLGRVGDLDFVL